MRSLRLHFDPTEMLYILEETIKYWHNIGPRTCAGFLGNLSTKPAHKTLL